MKILVTGGSGYIGSHTIISLKELGYNQIHSVDNYLNSAESEYLKIERITNSKIEYTELDLSDREKTFGFFSEHQFDAVIHFAALKSVPESVDLPTLYYNNNLNALINVLDAMTENGINYFIFSSSCAVYGNPEKLPVTEKTPFGKAESPYAHTKQIGETIIENHCKVNPNFKALSLRYFNPAGAHKSGMIGEVVTKRPNNLVPIIAQQAIGIRESFTVFGSDYNTRDGSCIRDYIHVSDISEAHVLGLEYLKELKGNYDVLNLGNGNGYTTLEVVKAFSNIEGVQLNFEVGDRRAGDVESIFADNSKARFNLNWNPKYDLPAIVDTAWTWQKNAKL